MAELGNRVAVLSLSRFANYALMLISPIVLVRLLSVEQFGELRTFLLYATLLQVCATFSAYDSLLCFVPAYPESPWRLVRRAVQFASATSLSAVLLLVLADFAAGRALVGDLLLPLVLHTLVFVNLDFWEFFLLVRNRPGQMLAYTASRLAARTLVTIVVAAWTRDVWAVIWALIGIEFVRMLISAIVWRVLDRSAQEPALRQTWGDQLRFCVPSGLSALVQMVGRNLSDLAVTNVLGAARFAQYAVGRYADPIVVTVRNSISSIVLPEMVRRDRHTRENPLDLWQRATVVNAVFLLPIAFMLALHAEPVVVTVFGSAYRDAALVMQIYSLVLIRECFDFAPVLRAANRTGPILSGALVGLLTAGAALFVLLPDGGIAGAMLAFVIAAFAECIFLGWCVKRLYQLRLRSMVAWKSVGKTALAAALASPALLGGSPGFVGMVIPVVLYLTLYAAILFAMRVPESFPVFNWSKRILCAWR
jgi:O-antigen/teichoic acid export membrane protein